MFDSEPTAKQFLRSLKKLSEATKNSKPATIHNSVVRVLKASDGFTGSKLDELFAHIANPQRRKARSQSTRSSQSKLRPYSSELVEEIQQTLKSLLNSQVEYEAKAREYARTCGAKTLKAAAGAFAAAPEPSTKSAALQLLISERANRVRTTQKISESGKASPW
ncbi:MAG: hypothetical protein AAFP81_02320 [Pseudomonadota bacterium]